MICLIPFSVSGGEFRSLKVPALNVRSGPGRTHPVLWEYTQKHTPVKIINQYKNWTHIQDYTGQKGWVHKTSLSKNRTVLILKDSYLYKNASSESVKKAEIKSISLASLDQCNNDFCTIQIEGVKGYIAKKNIWGD